MKEQELKQKIERLKEKGASDALVKSMEKKLKILKGDKTVVK
jgi:hypothetical protein